MQQRWHEPLANVGGKEGNKAGLAGSGKRVGWALPVGLGKHPEPEASSSGEPVMERSHR